MKCLHRFAPVAAVAFTAVSAAQSPTAHTIRGVVASANGTTIGGAQVFLLEALDAATTDTAGKFTIRTSAKGTVTIVARRIGFTPAAIVVPADTTGIVAIALTPEAAILVPITVEAGAYRAGNERGATLSALDVVRTPGATADVARAMQTLPGVQNVDEGTGLFVRGGDVSETKVILNDMVMLSPYNYETPTGNFTVTVNPFLLDGIFFSSGGFGARYGNILSGVADLRTAGRPSQTSVTAVAGLASVSTGVDVNVTNDLAVHATAARNDTDLLFKLNGATRSYSPAPRGNDVSGSVIYSYRPTAEIKTFAIDRSNALGIGVQDPSFNGGYSTDGHSAMVETGWKDVFGTIAPSMSVSYSTAHRNEAYGVFNLHTDERWSQWFGQTSWAVDDRLALRAGGDLDWRDSRFVGTIPITHADRGVAAPYTVFDSPAAGGRNGAFAEADFRPVENLRAIAGLRTDRSTFTHDRTVDPRLSLAYKLADVTFTAAAGEYHQVSDPLYFSRGLGTPGLGPMAARQYVVGAQVGDGSGQVARVEIYDKQYHDLIGLTRDKVVVPGGVGSAHGADVFLKRSFGRTLSARLSYSYVDARRTDPNTSAVAAAPFDITHSMALIADKSLRGGWSVSGAVRYATGKPFTPVTGARFSDSLHVWVPSYAAPASARMPPAERLDLALSRVMRLGADNQLVTFFSVDNALNRDNLYEYTYNADYTQRIPVRSLFKRSFYFGASLTHLGTRP